MCNIAQDVLYCERDRANLELLLSTDRRGPYKGWKLANLYVQLPVCSLDWLIIREGVLCHLAGLKTKQSAPQVSVGGLGNALTQWIRQLEAFLLCYI